MTRERSIQVSVDAGAFFIGPATAAPAEVDRRVAEAEMAAAS
jgi:hypothetical protein